jgi:hypothetical protein
METTWLERIRKGLGLETVKNKKGVKEEKLYIFSKKDLKL